MKKTLLLFSITLLALTARSNTVVFNDLGPGGAYDPILGYNVLSPTFGLVEWGAQFIAGASGNLATVDLGLTYLSQGPVNVYLYDDASGSPNNASQTFLGSGTPTAGYGTTNNSLVSFAVAGTIPVTVGTTYWLVLKPASASVFDTWHDSLATTGLVAASEDDSLWVSAAQGLPAFRITAQGPARVPDSGSTLLLMLGSVTTLFVIQREGAGLRKKERP